MSEFVWIVPAAIGALAALIFLRSSGRAARTRAEVLDEVRRSLRSGVLDELPGRAPQARGRIGELEITVDLHSDPARPAQSPMWRILAVGPVGLDRPLEVRIADWKGWIDPWLQLGESVMVPAGMGPGFTVHAEHSIHLDHPVIMALRRQGPGLGPGAFHARPDLMRAEVRFGERSEDNRALFSFLHAMGEISAGANRRTLTSPAARAARAASLRVVTPRAAS
jgi:hypothetical protein